MRRVRDMLQGRATALLIGHDASDSSPPDCMLRLHSLTVCLAAGIYVQNVALEILMQLLF